MSGSAPPLALSESERAKLGAVDHAVALGQPSVPRLVAMLTEPSWVVRRAVVSGLASMGDLAVPALIGVLRSTRDDETRVAAAVDALAASSGNVDDAMFALARDANPAIVCDAVQVLGRRRVTARGPFLQTLTRAADDNVAVAAIEALGRIGGSAAVECLAETARSNNFFRVFPAIDVLGRAADPRAVAPLAALLGDPLYALEAARALGRTGESAAVAPLLGLLARPGDVIARVAAVALAELHERAEERHGTSSSVSKALRSSASASTLTRRLAESVQNADAGEQVAMCVVLGSVANSEAVAMLTDWVDSKGALGHAAENALARLSLDAESQFLGVLTDGGSAARLAVLPLLTSLASGDAVVRCLSDADPAVRARACGTLARLGDPTRVGPLFERLEDPDTGVVHAAVAAIQALGGSETEKRALALSHSAALALRRAALRILAYFGYASAFDVLSAGMSDGDPRVRDAAIGGLAIIEDERATSKLLARASDPKERTRAAIMKALGQRALEARTLSTLVAGLSDEDAWVRYYACQSIGRLAVHDAAKDVERLLFDSAGQVRVAAVEALSLLGGDGARRALAQAVRSEDEDIRRAALVGLGMTRHPGALEALIAAAHAADSMTRLIAVSAIATFDAPEALAELVRAAADHEDAVRTAAFECLASRPGQEGTLSLIGMLESAEAPERIVAALASPAPLRIQGIVSALFEADERLARLLVAALGRMRTTEATAALVDVMATHPATVRKVVATTLGALGTAEARGALRRAATDDEDAEVRTVAALIGPS